MTVSVALLCRDSIVMASDSRATMTTATGAKIVVSDESRKLYVVGDRFAVLHRGSTSLGGVDLLADLRGLERGDGVPDRMSSCSDIVRLLATKWSDVNDASRRSDIYVGGYRANGVGEVWVLHLPGCEQVFKWRTPGGPYGATFYDSLSMLTRILHGRDARILDQPEVEAAELREAINRFPLHVQYNTMSQDTARQYVLVLISFVLRIMPFASGVGAEPFTPDAGGPIQFLQLTPRLRRADIETLSAYGIL